MIEIRCKSGIMHAILTEEGLIEVTCRSARCGHRKDVVVLHRFDPNTGAMIETKKFRQPEGGEQLNGHSRIRTSVRTA